MENNSYYNNQPKSIQLEESPDFNALNDAFFNENNIVNIDNLNNFIEKLSNVSDKDLSNENFNLFMDIFNDDKIPHLNETCNNLSVFGDNEVKLNNDLNNNLNDDLMLGKKSNKNEKSVFNFKCKQLIKKLTKFLYTTRKKLKKLKDPEKIKSLTTSISVFEKNKK